MGAAAGLASCGGCGSGDGGTAPTTVAPVTTASAPVTTVASPVTTAPGEAGASTSTSVPSSSPVTTGSAAPTTLPSPPPPPGGQAEWSYDFDEPDGTSLLPAFAVSSQFETTLTAQGGKAVPGNGLLSGFLAGQADPTNCFAEVTFTPADGGNYGPVINHDGPAIGDPGNVKSGYFLGWYQGDTMLRLWVADHPDPIGYYDLGEQVTRDVTFRLERKGDRLEVFVDGESAMVADVNDAPVQPSGDWVGMVYRYTDTVEGAALFTSFAGGNL